LKANLDESQPIFQQIAQMIMDEIIEGHLQEEERIPSENELSSFYNINRATVRNGLQSLVDTGIIYKQRGIGMFVKEGGQGQTDGERQRKYREDYIVPLLAEGRRLGLGLETVLKMIEEEHEKK
jgi:GntR family transcriptional regulator